MTRARATSKDFDRAISFVLAFEAEVAEQEAKNRELADDLLSKVDRFGGIVANMHNDIFATHESKSAARVRSENQS